MTDQQNAPEAAAEQPAAGAGLAPIRLWFGAGVRAFARLWVVGLLVAAAIASGVALNQMFQAQSDLDAARRLTGPDGYAIVAYKRELERQLEEYRRSGYATVTPAPPPRPRLLEEIDLARARNREEAPSPARPAAGGGGAAATTPVIRAPD